MISELLVSPCDALVINAMYIFSRRILFWLPLKIKKKRQNKNNPQVQLGYRQTMRQI